MTPTRRYPIGIQTFSEIINGGYVYVDKTDLMWKMQQLSKYIFLSRPRRFGKSLLSSTLCSFFRGEKELFANLKVENLEKDWTRHPVFHLDLSGTKHMSSQGVKDELNRLLDTYEQRYGVNTKETTPGMRFAGLIQRAYQQEGEQAVVIVDEYDAPLLDVLHHDEKLIEIREIMQEFFQRLKQCEPMLRFCFITGITKFSQLSIFSTINNLTNITMDPEFSAICGITEHELTTTLNDDIANLAEKTDSTWEETHGKLKLMYDGYHFSENSEEVYNPYSLMKAFVHNKIANYWFESGTPTFLILQMQHFHTDITSMDEIEAPSGAFDRPTEAMTDCLPLLYQSGYLTIKEYNQETQTYQLSIPNQEVRIGYTDGLLPTYIGIESYNVQVGFAAKFWRALKANDIDTAMEELKAYLASLPYIEGFKKKLEAVSNAEGFYEWTFYLIFSMLNVYVRTQVKCINGRTDVVVHMPDTIYVFELKTRGTAAEALAQIEEKGYAIPYECTHKEVVKVGIKFSTEAKSIEEWAYSTIA